MIVHKLVLRCTWAIFVVIDDDDDDDDGTSHAYTLL